MRIKSGLSESDTYQNETDPQPWMRDNKKVLRDHEKVLREAKIRFPFKVFFWHIRVAEKSGFAYRVHRKIFRNLSTLLVLLYTQTKIIVGLLDEK